MWQSRFSHPLILIFPLLLALWVNNHASAIGQQKPTPPKTGTPTGNPRPGATRPALNCPQTQIPLTAIVANNGRDHTYSEHPTLWFYIPYHSEQISHLEFLLLDESERKTIYRTSIKLANQPGILKITVPAEPQTALAINQNYRWRLNLDCAPDSTIEPDLVVDGWIRRIPSVNIQSNHQANVALQPYSVYIQNSIWYDAITNLAEQHFADPKDAKLSAAWTELLKHLGFAEVSKSPLVSFDLVRAEN
ncbi:DUF928 domain-containing protein [Pantanalinema sp. GBBB05]|uniref:DUF928 domain-containing protein n=1 Tax=Pantanalinema sp. GBBB05 TaxID=2604139 RepID=UPI001E0AE73B|nr:DUF928 domain-containing protein [Pantanalinema sp. GBBB05]